MNTIIGIDATTKLFVAKIILLVRLMLLYDYPIRFLLFKRLILK